MVAGSLIGIALAAGAAGVFRHRAEPSLVASPAPQAVTWAPGERPAPAFSLADQNGKQVSLASLRGHTVLLAFMNSVCTDTCPIEGRQLSQLSAALAPDQRPVLVAISVNPTETSSQVARATTGWGWKGLDWRWLGGPQAQLAPVWKAFGIQVTQEHETVAHTPAVYLLDERGDVRAAYLSPIPIAEALRDIRAIVGSPTQPGPEPASGMADAVLAWTPGDLPSDFARRAADMATIARVTVVRSGTAWLTSSRTAEGTRKDHPADGLAIPIETAGVEPSSYLPFVRRSDRATLGEVARGKAILGETAAAIRGLGAGATLNFGSRYVEVAAVWPDALLGAHEMLVSDRTAAALGVDRERYALLLPKPGAEDDAVSASIRRILPQPGRVRLPGETPYLRQADAVLAPVFEKQRFGEFAAKPIAQGNLQVDDPWRRAYIDTRKVPVLGPVTCNRKIFPQLEGALGQIQHEGLAHLIDTGDYGGCYNPRFLNHDPTADISHHSWGTAIDINVSQNPVGASPHQDPRIVRIFEDWGFAWGGDWLVPDGMHFEYHDPAEG